MPCSACDSKSEATKMALAVLSAMTYGESKELSTCKQRSYTFTYHDL